MHVEVQLLAKPQSTRHVVVFTGAGMSAESGIPLDPPPP